MASPLRPLVASVASPQKLVEQCPPEEKDLEPEQQELSGDEEHKEPEGKKGRKRARKVEDPDEHGGEAATKIKRLPRYYDKAFGELTVNDFENIVREAISLQRQNDKKDEELAQLKTKFEKFKEDTQESDGDPNVQADRVKKALEKALTHQMNFQAALKDDIQAGREIVAVHGNVSPEVLKKLGLQPGSNSKYSDSFFGQQVLRSTNGVKLELGRMMTVKWYKTTCELRVDASYSYEKPKKPVPKKKGGGKGRGKKKTDSSNPDGADGSAADVVEGAAEAEDALGEDAEMGGEENNADESEDNE